MGWNGSTGVSRQAPEVKQNARSVRAWFVVGTVIIVSVAIYFFVHTKKNPVQPVKPISTGEKKIVEVAPAKPVVTPQESVDDPKFKGLPKERLFRTRNGKLVYLPKAGEERFPGERAQALAKIGGTNNTVMVEEKRVIEDPNRPWMYHNTIHAGLAQYARPGEFAVPMNPNISDKVAREAIATPVEFHEKDTDRQIEEKQMVKDFLNELKDYMDKGGHAKDYFNQLHERQSQEDEIMLTTRTEVTRILSTGDVEGARSALNVFNQYRKQKGLPPMRIRKLNCPTSQDSQSK